MDEENPVPAAPGRSRRALGRGLDALLPTGNRGLREVEVDQIEPNPQQPRRRFEQGALRELADSIRQHGILQPLVVSTQPSGRCQLVVGERRWQAAKLAGLRRVPVVEKDVTDRQSLELALIENVQRADLNAVEEAQAYQNLVGEFGLTQEQVARRVGKSRAAVTNTLRLLTLPEMAKRAVVEGRITEGHARALLALDELQEQLAVLQRIESEGLTVRQTEDLVRRLQGGKRGQRSVPVPDPEVKRLEAELQRALGTKVILQNSRRGGRIVIEYYSPEELAGLYDRLTDR